ncbi:MAG: sulfonate ABC transporter substrate-binding protein, partial [Acinetobacter junii]|nr:sulfonate ABC transporter substrate-binding protein [Acinetobacter junii]
GVQPISEKVAKEQQYVADAFFAQKLIPKQLVIQDAILKNDVK